MDDLDEVIGEFLAESLENVDRMEEDLLALEQAQQPSPDPEMVASVFRAIHTIKGTCAFLGFNHLERVANEGETVLGKLRDGQLPITPEITNTLLSATDVIRGMLTAIETTGSDEGVEHTWILAALTALSGAAPAAVPQLGALLLTAGELRPEDLEEAVGQQARGDARPLGEVLVDRNAVAADVVREALDRQQTVRAGGPASSIRVDVALLDDLTRLVSELAEVRNQILQPSTSQPGREPAGAMQRLDVITT